MGTGLRFVRAIARTVAALSLPAALVGVFLVRATSAVTPSDRWNVELGIRLWDQHRYALTLAHLRSAVLASMSVYRSDPNRTEVLARLQG